MISALLHCRLQRLRACNNCVGSIRLSFLVWVIVAFAVAASAAYTWHQLQDKPAIGQGLIELSDISLEHAAGQLKLQAGARIRLPATVQAGLDSGVPLTFVLHLNVNELQRFWLDKRVFAGERHYTLTYYELTRHYRVRQIETDTSRNFRSLSSALAGLGRLGRVEFATSDAQDVLLAQEGLVASLNMRLSKSALPLPLQPIIRSSWTLASEEYRWPAT